MTPVKKTKILSEYVANRLVPRCCYGNGLPLLRHMLAGMKEGTIDRCIIMLPQGATQNILQVQDMIYAFDFKYRDRKFKLYGLS